MRYTIVGYEATVSFVAHCEILPVLVAACSENPTTLAQFIIAAGDYDPRVEDYIANGLAVFDEHNSPESYDSIHQAIRHCRPHQLPVFRVVDKETRKASLEPVKAGIIIFNLLDRRIVQVMNCYEEVKRRGRVRVRDSFGRAGELRSYELPLFWAVVP